MNFIQKNKKIGEHGFILSGTLVFALISVSIIVALTSWFGIVFKTSRDLFQNEQAFQLAESGVEYYRWHLAHAPTDFYDGTGNPIGPYVHDVKDVQGNVIGQYSLNIIPPNNFSTIVTVESTGTLNANPNISRTVKVKFAKPSLAKYAFISDSNMRFGVGTEVFGPIHSNGGIRFDGVAHNIVTSAKESFTDTDSDGGSSKLGVYTTVNPADPLFPATVPNRQDVFESGRQFPMPNIPFNNFSADLPTLKQFAVSNGSYFTSAGSGHLIKLKNNDTYDISTVTALQTTPTNCKDTTTAGWGIWSVKTSGSITNKPIPANGVIYLDDNTWVEGQINTAKVTIVAPNIIVNNDLLYTNYDGSDTISLIAQNNISAGLYSEEDLRIDAALIAQTGRIGRFYYNPSNCGNTDSYKDTLTLYGMLATKLRYGFAYTNGTGYATRNLIYDANLLYNPPPHFPLTSDQYEVISWEQVK